MGLDIDLLRAEKGGDPESVRQSQKNRFKDVTLVDQVVEHDTAWRKREKNLYLTHTQYTLYIC